MGFARSALSERTDTSGASVDEASHDRTPSSRGATRPSPGVPELRVGASDDPAEHEADRIARQVVDALAAPDAGSSEGEPLATGRVRRFPIRRSAVGGDDGGPLDPDTSERIQRARSGGRPVPLTVRRSMQTALGADLSRVRLHHGAEATDLNDRLGASAFTTGRDIFFRDGLPDTSTDTGRELLAHEVVHTLQQEGQQGSASSPPIGRIQRKRRGRKPKRGGRNRRRRQAAKRRRGGRAPTGPEIVAPDAESGFTKLAPLLDAAAPTKGDSAEIEASVKVPLSPTSFIQLDMSGEVSRDDDGVELGVEIMVGYGGALPVWFSPELVGKLGGFVEAKGGTSAKALTLISYAYYRQCRESSSMPRELADRLWGSGGSGYEESEEWAAQVERDVFADDENAQVNIGLGGALELELDAEDSIGVSAAASAKVTSATSYSKSTLESSGAGGSSQLGRAGKETDWSYLGWAAGATAGLFSTSWGNSLKQRGAQKPVGKVERKLSVSREIEIGPGSGSIEAEVGLGDEPEYEIEYALDVELGHWDAMQLTDTIVAAGAQLRRVIEYLRGSSMSLPQHASVLLETADALGGLSDSFASARNELAQQLEEIGVESARKTKVTLAIEGEGSTTKNTLTLSYVTEHGFEAEALGAGIEASYSRERKLFSFEWPRS